MHWIFEPGLWANQSVRTGFVLGGVVALVSAVVGVFTVLRTQSFAGHALTDIAMAGGAGASLAGATALVGFIGGGVAGAAAMDAIGVQRFRNRDVATGVVLGAATGLAALFLFLLASSNGSDGSTQLILFGSLFSVQRSSVPYVLVLGLVTLGVLYVIHRPLLLSSLSVEMAVVRGVRYRIIGAAFMIMLAIAVGLSSIVIGSILSTALLIGPAAGALRLGRSVGSSITLAISFGLLATWLGIVLAYDSYYWNASHRALPVSFFVVVVVVLEFGFSHFIRRTHAPTFDEHDHSHESELDGRLG